MPIGYQYSQDWMSHLGYFVSWVYSFKVFHLFHLFAIKMIHNMNFKAE